MALSDSFVSFFVSFLLLARFASGQNKSEPKCPEYFECRYLKNMSYPFSLSPNCGLCVVDCGNDPYTVSRIRLSSNRDSWYTITGHEDHTIRISLPPLENDCNIFNNLSLPHTTSISFTIPHNITLFKCSNSTHDQSLNDQYFSGYEKFSDCKNEGFYVYHKHDKHFKDFGTLPTTCKVIQLPTPETFEPYVDLKDLYNLLASEFDLVWHLSHDCEECHKKRAPCLNDTKLQFDCGIHDDYRVGKKGGHKWKLIVGTVSAGVAFLFLICFVVFIIRHRRRKNIASSSYLLSRNTSLGPSSRTDVELGGAYPGVPVYTYNELEEVTNNFDSAKELGDGGFGVVYYGKLRDGREVAVKRLYEHNYKRVEQFMNEIKILTTLKHPNLVTLYGCTSRRSRELLLVYEYIPNGTVADHIHGDREKHKLLAWPLRMNIAIETASALSYLHHSDTIHRDVKTNNILLDHNFSVKVADFGLSRLFPTDVTHVSTAPQGTPGYVDPEYHECYQLTGKSDVYSFGVVLIELISSMPAVDITRHRHEINLANLAINRIQRCEFDELIDSSLGYDSDPEVKRMTMAIAELAFRCLQLDSELRPTMDEVLETLKDIKESKDNFNPEMTKKIPHSPESDDAALLKNTKLPPPSPNAVTDVWISSSSTIGGSP